MRPIVPSWTRSDSWKPASVSAYVYLRQIERTSPLFIATSSPLARRPSRTRLNNCPGSSPTAAVHSSFDGCRPSCLASSNRVSVKFRSVWIARQSGISFALRSSASADSDSVNTGRAAFGVVLAAALVLALFRFAASSPAVVPPVAAVGAAVFAFAPVRRFAPAFNPASRLPLVAGLLPLLSADRFFTAVLPPAPTPPPLPPTLPLIFGGFLPRPVPSAPFSISGADSMSESGAALNSSQFNGSCGKSASSSFSRAR
mmetsp:Transcript_24704/g.66592  ORF Transcript_24704/g.66592 Transcript_24704/m.66592 type:complete len:257 (-) Transcript_24704:853-1623(-)